MTASIGRTVTIDQSSSRGRRVVDETGATILGEFLAGSEQILPGPLVARVREINAFFEWLPLITLLEGLDIRLSLLYQPPGQDFHPASVVIHIYRDGGVVTGGHGSDWYVSDAEHSTIRRLKRQFPSEVTR